MDTLDRYPNIAEKIFNFLDPYEILDFKLVCKPWKSVLGNKFLVRKLKKIGQPENVTKEWLKIIDTAEELQIHIEGLSKILALRCIGVNMSLQHNLNDVPIITVIKTGWLPLVRFLVETNFDFLQEVTLHNYHFTNLGSNRVTIDEVPLFLALEFCQYEIVKLILLNSKIPLGHIRDRFGTQIMTTLDLSLTFNQDNHQFLNLMSELGYDFEEAIFKALVGKKVNHVKNLLAHVKKPFCELKNKSNGRSLLYEAIDLGNVDFLKIITKNYEMNNHCQIHEDIDPVSRLSPLHHVIARNKNSMRTDVLKHLASCYYKKCTFNDIQSPMNFAISQRNIQAVEVMAGLVDNTDLLKTFQILNTGLIMIDIVSREMKHRNLNDN